MDFRREKLKLFGRAVGPALAVAVYFIASNNGLEQSSALMASVAVLMSAWWITEAIPLGATALVPLILFPSLGLLSGKETAGAYINSTIFLFFGGFLIALAMEKWNLHKRIALYMISLFGRNPSSIIFGFMLASAVISMWISNTATAVMLLPIGLAVLFNIEKRFGYEEAMSFSKPLLLGIAYACSVGGVGTIIGTPPNLVFQRIYSISFPDKPEIVFSQWMFMALPLSLIMLLLIWLLLTKIVYHPDKNLSVDREIIKNERIKLQKMSYEERTVLIIFVLTAFLWIFREKIDTGLFIVPGWSALFPDAQFIDDGTVAISMGLLLFILPAGDGKHSAILDAGIFPKIPWEIILLFGGGFALAEGFIRSGLSDYIGSRLAMLGGIPPIVLIFSICLTITFLTELTSNTATSQIILPVLAVLSIELGIDPILIMFPATVSASMAFMMPVATPPNAIVFGAQRLNVLDMAKSGFVLNLAGAVIITIYAYLFIA